MNCSLPIGLGRTAHGAALFILLAVAPRAPAQSTWNNPAGGNWSVGGNWQAGTVPTSGVTTALVFGSPTTQTATYTATNDIANPFQLNGLTVNNASCTVTLAGSPLTCAGTNPSIAVGGAGNVVLSPAATVAATTTITGSGTGSLTFGGAITGGANNLVKSSASTLMLAAG